MRKWLLFIFLFSTILQAEDYFTNRILFCLKKDISNLTIEYQNGIAVTDNEKVNELLSKYRVTKLGKWLTSAKEQDIDGDIKLANIYRAEFTSNKPMQQLQLILADFRKLRDVYDAHLEEIFRITTQTDPYTPNDTRYNEQWYLGKIMANYAWGLWDTPTKVPGDSTIIIGIVDTGGDYDHPDIQNSLFWNLGEDINGDDQITGADENNVDDDGNGYIDDFRGWDFAGANLSHVQDNDVKPPDAGPLNELSHGTHCGGIIAATADNENGIASVSFSSKLLFTKHAADNDLEQPGIYNGNDGMLYCAQMGAKIINCSYGGPGYSSFTQANINNIVNTYGSIIVCAAGNDNTDNDNSHHYPSDYNNTIAVSALTATDVKAYYSNYGDIIDISAPGGEGSSSGSAILSTIHWDAGGYEAWQGTSMASPVAAGAFALLSAWFPNQDRQWIIDVMLVNADPVDDLNPSYAGQLGSGRVNIYNAIARNIFPYVTIESNSYPIVNDNGNGELNPGESGNIQITLTNDPLWLDANGVTVTLSSTSPNITFSDANANFSNIAAGSNATNTGDDLIFEISENSTLEPIQIVVTISANQSGENPYQVEEMIEVLPTLNQAGFPAIEGVEIVLPVACDSLFGTSEKHVIVLADDDSLYVFNENGVVLSGFPIWVEYTTAAPIIADMTSDGQKEIVIANRIGTVKVIKNDGSLILNQSFSQQIHGNATVANMDADLDLEIIFATMSTDLHVINLDGSELPGFPINHPNPIQKGVAVGDLTDDGIPEIVFGLMTSNELHAITADADTLANFPITLDYRVNTTPVIAHLKSTTTEHMIFVTTTNHDLKRIELDGTQTNLYASSSPINSNLSLCDINNDASLEILFGTDAGRLYAFNFAGDSLFNYPVQLDGKISTSPVFSDFDNDDVPEIVVSTESGNLYVLKNDGTNYKNFPAAFTLGLKGSASIDDLDDDGDLEVFVGGGNGMQVLDVDGQKGSNGLWNSFMANNARTGDYVFEPTPSDIAKESIIPTEAVLMQNFPNPFNPETTIEYRIASDSEVELSIFNVLGQLVKTLIQANQNSGTYFAAWDGQDRTGQKVVSGVYFYKLTTKSGEGVVHNFIKKMLLVR